MGVSIPFKRESTCEQECRTAEDCTGRHSFQFPSNGKARVNLQGMLTETENLTFLFQFPSNGKARVNARFVQFGKMTKETVSIPFKRESTCEQVIDANETISRALTFQFPSNGKARVNPTEYKG